MEKKDSNLSLREQDWIAFSNIVLAHIRDYTLPQYGDRGNDLATDFTSADCALAISKYSKRHGKNSRPGQDGLDFLKIAHYAQMGSMLLGAENAKK